MRIRGKTKQRQKRKAKGKSKRQKQKQNAGVLRFAQNDKQKKRQRHQQRLLGGDGLHPTHRKVRAGWGTRSVVAGEGELVLWYQLDSG
jgi:hypothetical protein